MQYQAHGTAVSQANTPKNRRQPKPDVGEPRPGLRVDRNLRRAHGLVGETQPFQQEPANPQEKQHSQHPGIGVAVVKPVGMVSVAPPPGPAQPADKDQPQRIENDFVDLVKVAHQDLSGSGAHQRNGKILLDGDDVGADKERQEACEDQ